MQPRNSFKNGEATLKFYLTGSWKYYFYPYLDGGLLGPAGDIFTCFFLV